jgi:hypothetical protein
MTTPTLLTAFNDHFMEFVNDIHEVFPDDVDILSAKNSFSMVRKMNPKLLIKSWDSLVVGKYQSAIESGDLSFFMNKDYTRDLQDVPNNPNAERIVSAIDRLRTPIKSMSADNQAKIMKYIQNLTKISNLYNMTQ